MVAWRPEEFMGVIFRSTASVIGRLSADNDAYTPIVFTR